MNNKTLFINYLVDAANNNIPEDQGLLGCIYYLGYNVNCDYFNLGISKNEPNSQLNLGLMYLHGNYVKKDINKALYYLDLSSKQNNKYAQNFLGYIYLIGQRVPVDIWKAIHYLEQEAKQNNPEALFCLGVFYLRGEKKSKKMLIRELIILDVLQI